LLQQLPKQAGKYGDAVELSLGFEKGQLLLMRPTLLLLMLPVALSYRVDC